MNRHYFNFIAMFNAALKTKRMNFVMPLRNKFILNFLNILLKKGLIDAYAFENKRPPLDSPFLKLARRRTNFYYPIKVFFKPGLLEKILSISTPGKYRSLTRRDLDRYVRL
jgi:ribosomal protein S8